MPTIASMIDHTILAPETVSTAVARFCSEAMAHQFFSVCVNPVFVADVLCALDGSGVKTCCVIGFPLGASVSAIKAAEAARACQDGAVEIDMVIAVGALKAGRRDIVREDIGAVRAACPDATLKVIIETCLLTDEEKILACTLARREGADFVKTSTGFSTSGATIADVALMRATVGASLGVKASGGIRTREAAEAMIAAGANRIGTSAGIAILGAAP